MESSEIHRAACLPFFVTVLASKFGSLNLKPLSIALNAIQAWALWKGTQDSEKFQTAYKAQVFFNIANVTVNFWSIGYLVNELGKKYPFFNMNLTWTDSWNSYAAIWKDVHPTWTGDAQRRFGAHGYGALIIGLATTYVAVSLINRYYASSQKQLTIQEYGSQDAQKQKVLAKEVEISWDRPSGQKIAQWIYVSQICLNIALVALTSSRIYFAINLALSGYALYQITQRKWLNVSRNHEWEIGPYNTVVQSVQAVYRCFLMPISATKNQTSENCAVCLEKEPDVYFHAEHPFHETCLIQFVIQKSDDFIKITSLDRRERWVQGNRAISYRGTMPSSSKPGCPNCREKPFYNELDIIVHERGASPTARITWVG